MRGKQFAKAGIPLIGRITPARAGKTWSSASAVFVTWDHPRACGENKLTVSAFSFASGSPPRVRGKRLLCVHLSFIKRITPARAGKTHGRYAQLREIEDHPRACGENAAVLKASIVAPGSPPRVRGKLFAGDYGARGRGITPARAGKTAIFDNPPRSREDHPRACGENSKSAIDSAGSSGSPPRVRGKLSASNPLPCSIRITPARAGKTCLSTSALRSAEDHPRACGENRLRWFRS